MLKQSNKDKIAEISKLCSGFSKLTLKERLHMLEKMGFLTHEDLLILNKKNILSLELANHFIENVISIYQLPLGVAVNFVIDGRPYVIPMAIEETSIIAAASKTAKWIRDHGEIKTKTLSQYALGQIQIPRVKNYHELNKKISVNKQTLIDMANANVAHGMVLRGGGVRDISIRSLSRGDGTDMAVIHVMIDTCDAMGANIINQVCEFLKDPIEQLTNERVGMCILSNLADTKITQARVIIRDIDPELGEAIAEGSLFAQIDPYRAATNNKGVVNGMDGILIATGNDWRAVEAGIHAYAARSGKYSSITRWYMHGKDLYGVLEAPIQVGIVGGVTKLHPLAKLCLKLLGIKSANELARVVAAAGLVENLASIRAIVSEGIIQGHMKLHINNLAIASGASKEELPILNQRLQQYLKKNKHVSGSDVKEIMDELRSNKGDDDDNRT